MPVIKVAHASLLYTASQLVRDLSSPTQEDPGVPAHSQVVAEILRDIPKPENFNWVAKMDAHNTEEQDNGLMDPCLPSPSVELPQGQGSSRQKFEPWSFQSEPTDQKIQEFVQEAQRVASLQDTSFAISGHSSKPQEVSNCRLELVGERMLWDWYQPERGSVWAEQKVMSKLNDLKLAPEQQSAVDSGIRFDQWALGRTQSQ